MTLQAARDAVLKALGGPRLDAQAPPPATGPRRRVVLLSDLHAPWTRLDVYAAVLRERADLAIIIGDVDDGYEASRYPKKERAPIVESWAYSRALLEAAARTWHEVVVVEGNHDTRLAKAIGAAFHDQPGLVEAIRLLAGGELSPLRALTSDLPNVTVAKTVVGRFDVDWYWQLGDMVVAHAEKFSATPAAAPRAVGDWFRRMEKQLGLKPWRVLVLAHTHQLSMLPYDADKLLLESGCVAQVQGYQLDPKVSGLPQRLGYLTLDMVNDKVDVPSVRMHWLE